jgi:hypothetical protein
MDTSDKPIHASENLCSSNEWLIVHYSAIGKDHRKHNKPCQDHRSIQRMDQQWGVAVCCDGAGSAEKSDIGSRFVAEQTANVLALTIEKEHWLTHHCLPTSEAWNTISRQALYQVYQDLESFAQVNNLELKLLACTVIAVIYSPIGLLVTHIGDGRAAYCNNEGQWQAIMTPFKGEEANMTVFITSSIWHDPDKYIESRVILDKPFGFTLLSDGCENFAFLTYINTSKTVDQIKIEDINLPFQGFYHPIVKHLKAKHLTLSHEEIQAEWAAILESGTEKIKDTTDDKTMILGLLV